MASKPPDGAPGEDSASMITHGTFQRQSRGPDTRSRFTGKDDMPIKIIGPNNEEILPENIIVAPDGAWGWVVVFAAFTSNLIVDGTVFSFGLTMGPMAESVVGPKPSPNSTKAEMVEYAAKIDIAKTQVAWVGGMLAGFYLATGPIVSSMANIFGFRPTALAGCLISFLGFFLAYLLNMNAAEKYNINLPALYGFIGFVGGVGLCLMYVPSIITVGFYFDKKRALATGIAVCGSGVGTFVYAPMVTVLLKELEWPLTILVEGCLLLSCIFIAILYRPLKPSRRLQEGVVVLPTENESLIVRINAGESGSQMVGDEGDVQPNPPNSGDPDPAETKSMKSGRSTKTAQGVTLLVEPGENDVDEYRTFRVANTNTLNKPMHRPDIFYAGSLNPDKTDEGSPSIHWEAVPVSPTESGVLPTESQKKKCKCYTFPILRKMLDFSLLKTPSFVMLALSGGIQYLGFFVPFAYIADLAIQNAHVDTPEANLLVAVIGVSNTIGRVVCGLIADKVSKQVLLINNVALTVAGVTTALTPFLESYWAFIIYAIIFGGSVACFISLRSILVVELLGISKLTNAFGLVCLFQGTAAFVGGPLAGILKQMTGDYKASFYAAGAFILVAGLFCYPLHYINNWEKKRSAKVERVEVKVT